MPFASLLVRGSDMGSPFVHVEFSSRNAVESKRFYEGLFGWKFQHDPKMNYYMLDTGSPPGGGLFQNEAMPPGVQVYVGVKDADATLKQAEALGATVMRWKEEIPGFGWFGIFRDPEGITMAVYQSTPPPKASARRRPARRAKGRKKAARRKR